MIVGEGELRQGFSVLELSVDYPGLELMEIYLPLPPQCWDYRHMSPYLVTLHIL